MSTELTTFSNPTLNRLGEELIINYKGFHSEQNIAKEHLGKAIVRRFLSGKLLFEYHDLIIEEMGSQRKFGEHIGVSESMLSNDKRAYEALLERGVDTPEKMFELLNKKGLKAGIYEWERLPSLLVDPDAFKDRRAYAEKRLEKLATEVEDIIKSAESANNNHIAELARDTMSRIGETKEHLDKMDPLSYQWESLKYRNWAKSLGWDFIKDEPAENLEFHHTDMMGGSGGSGKKLPDVFGLPVSLPTHRAIESGAYRPTPIQIASGLIKLLTLFIITHWNKDD